MELNDYLRVLRTYWVGVLVAVLVCLGLSVAWTATRPKVYAASASGMVSTGMASSPALASVDDALAKSRATSYVDVAQSRAVAQAVIDRLHLSASPAELVTKVNVTQPTNTVMLEIQAEGSSPRQAQQVADAWVAALTAQVQTIEVPHGQLADGVPRVIPLDQAALPTSPVAPNPKRNALLGIAAGLLLGFGYALLRSTLDRRLRTVRDVEDRLHCGVVGVVPTTSVLRRGVDGRYPIVLRDHGAGPAAVAAEAFRKIRTNLMFMDVDHPPRAIVISSPRSGDGKSTVSANVAAALASSGQPVVLVDADLRRPMVATGFGVDARIGLSDVLSGQVEVEHVLQEVPDLPGLRILTCGTAVPNPSEIVGSHAMKALIERLARDAFVILDAPPLLPVTDAALLSTAADGLLLVLSSGSTLDFEAQTCLDAIAVVGGKVSGVVLNRTPARHDLAGFYGYQGYGGDTTSQPAPRRSRLPALSGARTRQ